MLNRARKPYNWVDITGSGNGGSMLTRLKRRINDRLTLIVRSAVYDVVGEPIPAAIHGEAVSLASEATVAYRQIEALVGLYGTLDMQMPLPPMRLNSASPDLLAEIARTVRASRPLVTVELGAGVSTIVTAYALKMNGTGHLYTLEHDFEWAERARGYLAAHGLSDWATILHRPLKPLAVEGLNVEWYDFSPEELGVDTVNLLVVDGPPAWDETNENNRCPALYVFANMLSDQATIIVDDMIRPGEQRALAMWDASFGPLDIYEPAAEKGMAIISWSNPSRAS